MKKILRLAAYVRVSHDEQVKYGYSIDAQKEALEQWAKENGYIIVAWYIDEGVSGRKKVKNRPQMQQMLKDVEKGEFDLIVFVKLDRYFRSVAEYHATQQILDANRVNWKSITEDYDTTTPDGRFKINIMLSIAEQEADKTSVRIKFTFDYKVKKKQPLFGSQPFGYQVGDNPDGTKCVEINPDKAPVVYAVFDHFPTYKSVSATTEYINHTIGYKITYNTVKKILTNTYYYGYYRGVDDYCPAYITKEQYITNQYILQNRNIKTPQTRRVYLFTGLIRCHACGKKLTSCFNIKGGKTYYNYRCDRAHKHRYCENRQVVSELQIEKYLLEKVKPELEKYITEIEINQGVKVPKIDKQEIIAEMERISYMFQKNRMSVEDYDKQYTALENKLEMLESEEQPTDTTKLKEFLQSDILDIYSTLSREDKRAAWSSILKEIHVDEQRNFTPIFL